MERRILVAEDDDVVRRFMQTTLISRGFGVMPASNGAEAVRIATVQHPDAIILDINMPEMDGLTACRRLRAQPSTATTPIIFLTGNESLEDKMAAFEAGGDDYLIKPFQPRELVARVNAILKRAEVANVTQAAPPPTPAVGRQPEESQIVGVFGCKGGVGTTMLSVNLALALTLVSQRPVYLVDLALDHAVANAMLDIVPRRQGTLSDMARHEPEAMDWESVGTCLLSHSSGLSLLAGPPSAEEGDLVKAEHVEALLKLLRARSGITVLDLGSCYRDPAVEAFGLCDTLLLVVSPEITAIKTARSAVSTLQALEVSMPKVKLVLNYTQPVVGITANDVRRAVGVELAGVIPCAGLDLVTTINQGKPLVLQRPDHQVAWAIRTLAASLAGVSVGGSATGRAKPRA